MHTTRPKLRAELIFRQLEEDLVVYDPVTDITALLNASAAAVLDLCDGTRESHEIAAEVAAMLKVDGQSISGEVKKALNDLSARGYFCAVGHD
jgi:hypothetical protein